MLLFLVCFLSLVDLVKHIKYNSSNLFVLSICTSELDRQYRCLSFHQGHHLRTQGYWCPQGKWLGTAHVAGPVFLYWSCHRLADSVWLSLHLQPHMSILGFGTRFLWRWLFKSLFGVLSLVWSILSLLHHSIILFALTFCLCFHWSFPGMLLLWFPSLGYSSLLLFVERITFGKLMFLSLLGPGCLCFLCHMLIFHLLLW